MTMSEENAVAVYRELATVSSLVKACITSSNDEIVTISSNWSQRDLERGKLIKFNRNHTVLTKQGGEVFDKVVPGAEATELNEELLSSTSPCGHFKAVIRKVKNKKGEDQQYCEIWTSQCKSTNVNLTVLDKHGKVYNDSEFGCFNWSSDSKRLVFIAEQKQAKTVSYFDRKSTIAEDETDASKESSIKGEQYLFRDDWGETLVDKCSPVICIFDVATEMVEVLEGLPEDVCPAQATWGPDNAGILFSGLFKEPYKLGAIYCDNRRSAIFYLTFQEAKCDVLGEVDKCCRSPQFNPDRSKVVYLQNDSGGPHKHCKQLMLYDWSSKKTSLIVDVVLRPKDADSFPGLFIENLPNQCWSADNSTVYLTTAWRSTIQILSVDTTTKDVTIHTKDNVYTAWSVQDVRDNLLLAHRTALNKTGQLIICDLNTLKTDSGQLDWFVIEDNQLELDDISWKIICLPQSDGLDVEGLLLAPEECSTKTQLPLVIFPHGGPHSCIPASYSILLSFLCRMNFIVVCVNYRGSTGFGQDSIYSLLGKVGSQDVNDVHALAEYVLKEGYGDKDKVLVTGGSHGGFLSLHMIGQFPNFYKVCAVRNPVTNIAAMYGHTDIPDWCCAEAGVREFSTSEIPTKDDYAAMLERSPITHCSKVKAPTLFLIGKEDLRVPPKQGECFYKSLRARGIHTKLLLYPENNHALPQLEAESDCYINIYKWFMDNL